MHTWERWLDRFVGGLSLTDIFFQTRTLQYLDLSQNPLDKKAMESIVGSLGSAPPQMSSNGHGSPPASPRLPQALVSSTKPASALLSLRVDDCALRPATLEILGAFNA